MGCILGIHKKKEILELEMPRLYGDIETLDTRYQLSDIDNRFYTEIL